MIIYDEGKWSILFAFQAEGSVAGRAATIALPCAVMSALLNKIRADHPHFADVVVDGVESNLHQGFIFVLGFLIVFRTTMAYSRWWEGGSLLQQLRGDWFNAYSNLLAFVSQSPDKTSDVEKFKHKMLRLFSLLYGSGLQQVQECQQWELEFFDLSGFEQEHLHLLHKTHDACEVILQWIQRSIVDATRSGVIDIAPPILSRVYNQLGSGMVKLSNARKIKEFPVPFPLAQLIAIMLIFHSFVTLIMSAVKLTHWSSSAFTTFIVIFSYWGVNYIAVELENPYGDDPNDLPILWMQEDMNKSLVSLLDERAACPPHFTPSGREGDFTLEHHDFTIDLTTSLTQKREVTKDWCQEMEEGPASDGGSQNSSATRSTTWFANQSRYVQRDGQGQALLGFTDDRADLSPQLLATTTPRSLTMARGPRSDRAVPPRLSSEAPPPAHKQQQGTDHERGLGTAQGGSPSRSSGFAEPASSRRRRRKQSASKMGFLCAGESAVSSDSSTETSKEESSGRHVTSRRLGSVGNDHL